MPVCAYGVGVARNASTRELVLALETLRTPALGRARHTFGGAMPPEEKKKKGSAAPKKQEAAATLTEEERLVLAQAEALKVRGGSGRASLFPSPDEAKNGSSERRATIPAASPRARARDPR